MAGVEGFEPTNEGVKVPCLATWLYPIIGAGEGTRTHTKLSPADFKSAMSTNSITPAYKWH